MDTKEINGSYLDVLRVRGVEDSPRIELEDDLKVCGREFA